MNKVRAVQRIFCVIEA